MYLQPNIALRDEDKGHEEHQSRVLARQMSDRPDRVGQKRRAPVCAVRKCRVFLRYIHTLPREHNSA